MVGGRPNNVLIEAKNGSLTGVNISGDPQILPGRIGGTVASIEQTSNNAFKRKDMMHKATNTIDRYTGDVMKAIVPIGSGGTPTADGKNEEVYYAKAIMKTPLDELEDDVWFKHTGSTGHTESTKGVFEEYEAWIPCTGNVIERLTQSNQLGKKQDEAAGRQIQ
jgi:CMP-2-keto-3-deoxyoctulosonic acid synthetase